MFLPLCTCLTNSFCMKKLLCVLFAAGLSSQLLAGGIVTNTNQSAHFVRLLSRNASTSIDAVYFNPAGLFRLSNGLHFSLNNQTIFQEKTVTTTFPLNNQSYIGDVAVPFFPSIFGVYKKDKLAISFGFGINGGGGSAEYANGLPSFEMQYSMIPGLVSSFGIPTTKYSADIYFKGSSIYYGTQLGATYAITDMIGLSAGARFIIAKNTYEGHVKDIQINPLHPQINPQGELISASQFFTAIGQPAYAAMTSDMNVDASQSGSAFTPYIGAHLNFDKLQIGIKYEMNTKLELTNKADADKDAHGMFLNDSTFRSDIPAILGVGIEYTIIDGFRVSTSWTHYFDKNANWNGKEKFIDKNLYELALGMEYDVNEKITLSAGFMHGQTGVGQGYQTDISFSNSSNTVGFGGRLNINEQLSIDLGALFVMYTSASEEKKLATSATTFIDYKETYEKSLMDFAIGVNYKF